MRMRYTCQMDGVELDSLAPSIYITDIAESSPSINRAIAQLPFGAQRVTNRFRTQLNVTVKFLIREYDTVRRKAVCQAVAAWAQGKFLAVNDRPGQRLCVECATLPMIASAKRWTNELSMVFTAWEKPCWEDAFPTTVQRTGNGSAVLRFAGTMPDSTLAAEITASGAVGKVTISCNGQSYTLTGLGMVAGDVLRIGHDEHGLQFMRVNDRSVLSHRQPDSSDEIMLQPRTDNTITLSADGSVSAVFSARGKWL